MRKVIEFALFPEKMSNGKWIWLKPYIQTQEYKRVWTCIRDLGWPDMGEWGWENQWITVKKEVEIAI